MNPPSVPAQTQAPACSLVSYIAPGAPATRRPAAGDEPFLRVEIGFTPAWYRQHAEIDFGARFHTDPAYRRECVVAMRSVLQERFPGTHIGGADGGEGPLDLLTGTYGAGTVAAIYGVPLVYFPHNWPNCEPRHLTDQQLATLEPPDLDRNPHFQRLMEQVEWIARTEGTVTGFINWQGVLNNAHRLRGEQLFLDLLDEPDKARHLFACVTQTMRDGIRRLHERQRASGADYRFVTVSNCLVNLVSPAVYQEFLLPCDQQLAALYGCIGIHNCAWNATPYLESYVRVPGVAYLDMGPDTDLALARAWFPDARRAVMIPPSFLKGRSTAALSLDIARIAGWLSPCDLVVADLDAGTPDSLIQALAALEKQVSEP
ncbi:MAG: hypothetical protein MUF04_01035 [Akkermansiaceae bacterium]|nr:hypothetical protein [Akkermansiaceae bacterium]